MKHTKKLIGTGVAGMTGLYAMGTLNSLPGMPSNNLTNITSAGVNLAAIGGLSQVAMNVIPKHKRRK